VSGLAFIVAASGPVFDSPPFRSSVSMVFFPVGTTRSDYIAMGSSGTCKWTVDRPESSSQLLQVVYTMMITSLLESSKFGPKVFCQVDAASTPVL